MAQPRTEPFEEPDTDITAEVVDPQQSDGLGESLIDQGFDRTKADELAETLRNNARSGRTPVGTPGRARTPESIVADQIARPDEIENVDLQGLLAAGSGIQIGNTRLREREVQDNELVASQLEGLISGDSRYIRNARLRGVEFANARGQLGSSFAAGAAERSAIEAALPIAQADAQAYRDVAAQNMNAWNTFALANLQRATTLDTAILSANTSINMANLDAQIRVSMANLQASTQTNIANLDSQTRTNIANLQAVTAVTLQNLQSELAFSMQTRTLTHDTGLEQLRQEGRIELALLDGDVRRELLQFEIDGRIDLSKLDHEETLAVNEILNKYDRDKQDDDQSFLRQTLHVNMASNAQTNYINYITSFTDSNMDANAAKRLTDDAWNHLIAELSMINGMFPEYPPIAARTGGA